MNTPSRLLRGSKASGRHSTVIPCAVAFIKRIKAMSCVSRFIPGKVAHVGNGKRRAYTAPIPGGVRVVIRGTCDRQEFAVFTSNVDAVADVIRTIEREEWQ